MSGKTVKPVMNGTLNGAGGSEMQTRYVVEWWHTENHKWYEDYSTTDIGAAQARYEETLRWHYARTVRLLEVRTAILKQSKPVSLPTDGIVVVPLDDPQALHNTLKSVLGE